MNLRFLVISLFFVCSISFANAKGGIPIIYSNGEDIIKVVDLPESDEFTIEAEDGRYYHANLGIMHEQFSLFWMPLINYGTEKYVLFTDTKIGDYDFTYVDLSNSDIQYLQITIGGIPSQPELPFWHAWGGKLLLLLIIGVLVVIGKAQKADEEELGQGEGSPSTI